MKRKEEQYKRGILIFLALFCVLFLCVWQFFKWYELRCFPYAYDADLIVEKDFEFNIDNVSLTQGGVEITGWLLKKGHEPKEIEEYVLLKEVDGNQCIKIPTQIILRDDLNNNQDEVDYSMCGFYALATHKNIDINKDYEICMLYETDGENCIVPLNTTTKRWEK